MTGKRVAPRETSRSTGEKYYRLIGLYDMGYDRFKGEKTGRSTGLCTRYDRYKVQRGEEGI
ncbi:hypothetical protein AMTR_s00025p00143670 [Amborella trichopoda]|uniref:Uncharacterized protein n=1 Tax=Amborella trichopoda TaxID=13333 RepID=W1PQX5_AMBTC|nr:hypothetical protein AMTR_s00025p00143670 [Amborella trichopoda]